MDLLIEHQCPQCGAPAVLLETDRLFHCDYCRVDSYLMPPGRFQYVLTGAVPENKEVVYFPYWRFKGMLFSVTPQGIKHQFVDMSRQAVRSAEFPLSLGLRSQALKLKFVTQDIKGRFLKADLKLNDVMEIIDRQFETSLPKPVLLKARIGESLSLIYAPFYMDETLYDGVLNEPLTPRLPDDFHIDQFNPEEPNRSLRFIATLCPGCGWDLKGERDSLILACKNCESLWRPTQKGLKKQTVAHLAEKGDHIVYLPFWRIRAAVSGVSLNHYADLIRIANLPKAVEEGMDKRPFYFWGPAFKVRPRTFLRLTTHLTLIQPQQKWSAAPPEGKLIPVTLPLKESVETLKLNAASFIKPRRTMMERLDQINIAPQRYLLVYLPFVEKHHDYIQPLFNLAVNKNQIVLAENL